MNNLLEKWKSEVFAHTSTLSIYEKPKFNRTQINFVYDSLKNHFGIDYFDMQNEKASKVINDSWIYYLLVNTGIPGNVFALIEIAFILENKSLFSNGVSKKLKQLLNDSRQLRDTLFELYIVNLLDYNGISLKKNPKKGATPLDLVCTINNIEFLGECKKLYSIKFNVLKIQSALIQGIIPNYLNRISVTFNLYGIIIINKSTPVYSDTLGRIEKNLINLVSDINANGSKNLPFKFNDEFTEIFVSNSSIHNTYKDKNYVIFNLVSDDNSIKESKITFDSNLNFQIDSIFKKLFEKIKIKNEQHKNSVYLNKIFFFDFENSSDLDLSLLLVESFYDEKKILEFIKEKLPKNCIICFIFRNYTGEVPSIKIKAYGNDISPTTKKVLEELRTNFAYPI